MEKMTGRPNDGVVADNGVVIGVGPCYRAVFGLCLLVVL